MKRKPRSSRTSSYVSPSIGLKGLRIERSRTRLLEREEMAKAVTYIRRSVASVDWPAWSSREEYSRISAARCRRDKGSFAETGMEMVDRSLPTFLRRKPIKLGGMTVGARMFARRFTGSRGSG